MSNPTRPAILAAIEKVKRNGLPLTLKNVRANVDPSQITFGQMTDALRSYIRAQVPVVMKQEGMVITDPDTRERKGFWDATPAELEQQMLIKEASSSRDVVRITADRAVIAFLREQEQAFGYEVYPGLFEDDINRIYRMHNVASPAA
jgi:hypothetical protein